MNILNRFPRQSACLYVQTLRGRTETFATIVFAAAMEADASAVIASAAWQALRISGLAMAPFSCADGVEDLLAPNRHGDLIEVLRIVGGADLSIGRLLEGHINAVALVCRYGTASQIGDLADAVATGAIAGIWCAEDAFGLHATREGDNWVLSGRKILASGAGVVARPVITAGQSMLLPRLAPNERADTSGWTGQGMRATAMGSVDFSGMKIGVTQVLGQPGDFMRQPYFSGGVWRFCAVHLGAAERLVDLFREHLVSRGRSADPFQLQRVAQCVAATMTVAFWVREAAGRMAREGNDGAEVVAFVIMTRMVPERAALDVLEAVHRGVGLQAFRRPHPLERISRDLATYLRQPVPDLAMADAGRAVVASSRVTGDLWGAV